MILSTEFIKQKFPHVLDNKTVIGKLARVQKYTKHNWYRNFVETVICEEKILVVKSKHNNTTEVIKFWQDFNKGEYCYSVFNEWTARELRNRILHETISKRGRVL